MVEFVEWTYFKICDIYFKIHPNKNILSILYYNPTTDFSYPSSFNPL